MDKGMWDVNEIDRIQKEIERNLFGAAAPSDEPSPTEPAMSITAEPAIVEPAEQAAQPESNSKETYFYSENIKNETNFYRQKKKLRRMTAVVLIICTLGTGTLGFGLGLGLPAAKNYFFASMKHEISGNDIDTESSAVFSDESKPVGQSNAVSISSLADIVNLVEPSVVRIDTIVNGTSGFFSMPYDEEGTGSGIVFHRTADKVFIVTNYHVIAGANNVTVSIQGSDPVPASFVGSEPSSDLAIISISMPDLNALGLDNSIKPALFGDSNQLQVGERVLAIGNAMGEGNMATMGIVSALNKEIQIENRDLTVIQTDAAINPGNSGGPLVNTRGEIIGINTAKFSQYNVEGMGYSISSNIAKPILEDIMQQKPKPFLGVQGTDVTKEVADLYQIEPLGVFVVAVIPNSSAEASGISRNDIITSFNNEPVFTMKQLQEEVAKCKVGDEVLIKLFREGKTPMSFTVKLAAYQSDNF